MATLSSTVQKTLNLLDESIALYQKNWEKYAGALIGVFLVILFAGVVNFLVGMLGRIACDSTNPVLLLLFCSTLFPFIGQLIIAFLLGFLAVPFTLSLLQPFEETVGRKPISSWVLHFSGNVGKALLASLLRLNACFLLFLEPELVLGRKGVFQAAKASFDLVMAKPGQTFAYAGVWYAVGILLWFVGSLLGCLTCLLNPVIWLVWSFLLYPIQNLSLVLLWKRVKELKEEEKKAVETPVPPEEYIRKAKAKMVLSWE